MQQYQAVTLCIFVCRPGCSLTYLSNADPLPPDQMYYSVSVGNKVRWIAIHGSSKLEGYHKWMNRLLSSGNTAPELAGPLMCHRNGRWNIDAGVRNDKGTDHGMYQLR